MKKLIFLCIFFEKILLFQGVILKSNDFLYIFFTIYACENDLVTDWKLSIQCIKREKSHKKSVFFRLQKAWNPIVAR